MPGPIVKYGVTFPVSDEFLRDSQPPPRQSAEDRVAAAEELKQERLDVMNAHASALASADPFRRAVLELHAPVFVSDWYPDRECHGCDFGGYDGDYPDFPCRTYDLAVAGRADQ